MQKDHKNMPNMNVHHYRGLLMMTVFSYVSMYILMYAMVNSFNQFCMAGLMTAPMVLIELFVMRAMFLNKRLNAVVIGASLLAGIIFSA